MNSSLYLYAITPGMTRACSVTGLQDAVPFAVDAGRLAAIVSRFVGPPPLPDADIAWRHESVVEALCHPRSVLPMRFGTLAADEPAIVSVLNEREDAFVAALEKVHNCVELGLRVLWLPAGEAADKATVPAVQPTTGREYLLRRQLDEQQAQARRKAAQDHAQLLCRRLSGLAIDSSVQVLPTRGLLLSAAFLVPRQAVDEFVATVRQLEGSRQSQRLLCTGPWPPYSFVGQANAFTQDGSILSGVRL